MAKGDKKKVAKKVALPDSLQLPIIRDVPRELTPTWQFVKAVLILRKLTPAELRWPNSLNAAIKRIFHPEWTKPAIGDKRWAEVLSRLLDEPVILCADCNHLSTDDYEYRNADNEPICEGCRDEYSSCDGCGTIGYSDDFNWIEAHEEYACDRCFRQNYTNCHECADAIRNGDLIGLGDDYYCEACFGGLPWCDNCEEHYVGDECPDCDGEEEVLPKGTRFLDGQPYCPCVAPHPTFAFPLEGGVVNNDTRFDVTLVGGTITRVGLDIIGHAVEAAMLRVLYESAERKPNGARDTAPYYRAFNPWLALWPGFDKSPKTAEGTLVKRIAKILYKECDKFKADDKLLTDLGNLVERHSDKDKAYHVEMTRDMNLGKHAYMNPDSCWHTTHASASRCSMKHIGGMAMRTWDEHGTLRGRAWVIPVDAEYKPTHDLASAVGHLVFNGYGEIDEHRAARLLAAMIGGAEKKLKVCCKGASGTTYGNYQYLGVNGDLGYLVAPQAILDAAPAEINPVKGGYIHGAAPDGAEAAPATRKRDARGRYVAA